MELVHIKGNTYYIKAPINLGVYVKGDEAILIDSGNDKDAGRKVLKLLKEKGWKLKMIVNTHSNADHIGANDYLQRQTDCRIAATRKEAAFINDPIIEPSFLYGAYPLKALQNKFLLAKPSRVTDVIENSGKISETDLKAFSVAGHFFDMITVKTPDNVMFIADTLFSKQITEKYHLYYLYNLGEHLKNLEWLKGLECDYYVPAHAKPREDIGDLIKLNEDKIQEVLDKILGICGESIIFENILKGLMDSYGLELNVGQYALNGSALKAFLQYLESENKLEYEFNDNLMYWKKK